MIVYLVTNKINNKIYIGQTVCCLARRKRQHISEAKCGSDMPFHRAIRKYGAENFTWRIFYKTDNLQDLNAAEEYIIAEYAARTKGYNVKYGGDNKRHSSETRIKIGAANKGKIRTAETRQKLSEAGKGRAFSAETREKLSAAKKGRTFSLETRGKISEAKKGEKHPMFGRHHSGETREKMSESRRDETLSAFWHKDYGLAFCTQYILREEFGLRSSHVSEIIHGRRKSCGGWSLATPEYIQTLRETTSERICNQ